MDSIDTQKATDLLQAQTHVYNHLFNYINSMCLKCTVELGIPDIIHSHNKPITLPELVSKLGIHPTKTDSMNRLMRKMVHSGFFSTTNSQENDEEAYSLTPSSMLLVNSNPNCLTPFVNSMLKPEFLTSGRYIGDWFRGGELTVFNQAHGISFWECLQRNIEFNKDFNEAMASDSRMMNLVIKDCKAIFEGVNSLVDVGGGDGSLVKIISEEFPDMNCTILELPHVIDKLEGNKKLNYVAGDMFQHIPSADAIIFKLVLHAFKDEECLKILKKCKEAKSNKGQKSGKLIVIDVVINEKKEEYELTETKLLFDILMIFAPNGKERTEKEWEALFMKAGFSHFKITPILGLRSLIEIYP